MSRAARPVLSILLAALLAVSSIGFAQARHQAAGQHSMVICTGYGLVTITLDADGTPVTQALPCPDILVAAQGVLADVPALPRLAARRAAPAQPARDALHHPFAAGHWHHPRAPPVPV